MSTEMHKLLSAILDGENSAKELPRALDRLCSEPELKSRWNRWVLVRECLHGNLPRHPKLGLNERVARTLAHEPVLLAPRKKAAAGFSSIGPARRYLKPVAGIAVAASVATVAILGLRGDEQAPDLDKPVLSATPPALVDLSQGPSPGVDVQYADAQLRTPVARQTGARNRAWLNEYLLRHTDSAGFAGRSGFLPYVSIVTTDPADSTWRQTSQPIKVTAPPK